VSLRAVVVDLTSRGQDPLGSLRITLLPNAASDQSPPALVDLRGLRNDDTSQEPVQLLESAEYRYQFILKEGSARITTDRPEIFQPDDELGYAGRLRPGLHVGRLPVRLLVTDIELTEFAFEVRSKKLDYESQYQWMLRDIANFVTEAIMERFAATEDQFAIEESSDPKTLYEKFAFLKSLLQDDQFQSAIRLILNRPYVAWHEIAEPTTAARGVPYSSRLARELTKPGPRLATAQASVDAELTWPKRINVWRTEESIDNPPNRFVKFALTRWRSEVLTIVRLLQKESDNAAVARGIREANQVIAKLDEFLDAPIFADVSTISTIPTGNPVLLRKEGYREVLRAFIQFEMAARLAWEGGEDVYWAGQRNVATLYEYWCFLELLTILKNLCSMPLNYDGLFQVRTDGLNLLLARGKETLLDGVISRSGRKLSVQLYFNRSFPTLSAGEGSWSRSMRPDCSIRIGEVGRPEDDYKTIWIHFDAKYRADQLIDVFGIDESEHGGQPDQTAKRDDLLKMHTYRDSIRRSAGAYVLYPGTTDQQFFRYHELLPGLGAFALRPSPNGDAAGREALKDFLSDVFDHAASQYTQHERSRYWNEVSFQNAPIGPIAGFVAPFLSKPPDDVNVLVGYVKSESHFDWVMKNKLYNLRADPLRRGSFVAERTELVSDFALLYGNWSYKTFLMRITGAPLVLNAQQLIDIGYPMPGGKEYLCLPLDGMPDDANLSEVGLATINRLRASKGLEKGRPFSITWAELIAAASQVR
jgi:uncharacterized protein